MICWVLLFVVVVVVVIVLGVFIAVDCLCAKDQPEV